MSKLEKDQSEPLGLGIREAYAIWGHGRLGTKSLINRTWEYDSRSNIRQIKQQYNRQIHLKFIAFDELHSE
jgi:hydroxyacyl-ACP dehydratase HTD2-like protein with hotdog domain